MAKIGRPKGAVNVLTIKFRQEFYQYCDQHEFSPGIACAKLMHDAAKAGDSRTFIQLLAVGGRFLLEPAGDSQSEPEQQSLLVVDRTRRESNAA